MRPSSLGLNEQLGTDYIDAKLKDLTYDQASHIVHLRYGDSNSKVNDKVYCF